MSASDSTPNVASALDQVDSLDPEIHIELIEQLMRITDDETLLYRLAEATNRTEVLIGLGAALPHLRMELLAGSPVLAALGVANLDPEWRRNYPPRPQSLWAELELMRSLSYAAPAATPLTELLEARTAANAV